MVYLSKGMYTGVNSLSLPLISCQSKLNTTAFFLGFLKEISVTYKMYMYNIHTYTFDLPLISCHSKLNNITFFEDSLEQMGCWKNIRLLIFASGGIFKEDMSSVSWEIHLRNKFGKKNGKIHWEIHSRNSLRNAFEKFIEKYIWEIHSCFAKFDKYKEVFLSQSGVFPPSFVLRQVSTIQHSYLPPSLKWAEQTNKLKLGTKSETIPYFLFTPQTTLINPLSLGKWTQETNLNIRHKTSFCVFFYFSPLENYDKKLN